MADHPLTVVIAPTLGFGSLFLGFLGSEHAGGDFSAGSAAAPFRPASGEAWRGILDHLLDAHDTGQVRLVRIVAQDEIMGSEEFLRGTAVEIRAQLAERDAVKGEMTVLGLCAEQLAVHGGGAQGGAVGG